jgi:hypothetical protein
VEQTEYGLMLLVRVTHMALQNRKQYKRRLIKLMAEMVVIREIIGLAGLIMAVN